MCSLALRVRLSSAILAVNADPEQARHTEEYVLSA
jgi:hypothetical protein